MRQIVLFVLLLGSVVTALAEEQDRLWYKQSLEDGGALKTWMVEQSIASEEKVSCGALVHSAWQIAESRGFAHTVNQEIVQSYTNALFGIFVRNNNLPCASQETELTWQTFAEIGQLNNGFTPFRKVDVDEAITRAMESVNPVIQTRTPAPQPKPQPLLIETVSPMADTSQSTEEVFSAPVATTQSVSPPTTYRRLVPVTTINTGETVDVIDVGRKPLLNQVQLEHFLQERAEAELETEAQGAEMTETTTQGGNEEQSATTEETRPWWIPRYQWDMEQRKRERPRYRRHPARASHAESFLRDYFWDIPEMVEVARCESTFQNVQSGLRYRDGRRERSFGFFQIHEPAWHQTAMELGLDNYQTDPMQNVLLARHLYELEGLHPWRMSRGCWGPRVRGLR